MEWMDGWMTEQTDKWACRPVLVVFPPNEKFIWCHYKNVNTGSRGPLWNSRLLFQQQCLSSCTLCAQPQAEQLSGKQRKLHSRLCPWKCQSGWKARAGHRHSQPKCLGMGQNAGPRAGEQKRENVSEKRRVWHLAWRTEYEGSLVWRDGSTPSRGTAYTKVPRLEKTWF